MACTNRNLFSYNNVLHGDDVMSAPSHIMRRRSISIVRFPHKQRTPRILRYCTHRGNAIVAYTHRRATRRIGSTANPFRTWPSVRPSFLFGTVSAQIAGLLQPSHAYPCYVYLVRSTGRVGGANGFKEKKSYETSMSRVVQYHIVILHTTLFRINHSSPRCKHIIPPHMGTKYHELVRLSRRCGILAIFVFFCECSSPTK